MSGRIIDEGGSPCVWLRVGRVRERVRVCARVCTCVRVWAGASVCVGVWVRVSGVGGGRGGGEGGGQASRRECKAESRRTRAQPQPQPQRRRHTKASQAYSETRDTRQKPGAREVGWVGLCSQREHQRQSHCRHQDARGAQDVSRWAVYTQR